MQSISLYIFSFSFSKISNLHHTLLNQKLVLCFPNLNVNFYKI